VDSAAIYIHRRAALSSYSNGTRSYIAERTQSAVYIVKCLWYWHTTAVDCQTKGQSHTGTGTRITLKRASPLCEDRILVSVQQCMAVVGKSRGQGHTPITLQRTSPSLDTGTRILV
jgi:hypothetical protein